MMNLWTTTKLLSLELSLRRKIIFYAPLLYSLDFDGIDPVYYTRTGAANAWYRGGQRTIAADVPPFEWTGDTPEGLWLGATADLIYSYANSLSDANTVIWFENSVPKSTPTNTNPFDSYTRWIGTKDIHISHVVKANAVLANSEIVSIQTALAGTGQVITPPTPPPAAPQVWSGTFITETPAGVRNGSNVTFTLSQTPDLATLLLFCFGIGALERVGATPGNMEFTISGTTITMGLAPNTGYPFLVNYRAA